MEIRGSGSNLLLDMPIEILIRYSHYLSDEDIARLLQTSSAMANLFRDDNFWRERYQIYIDSTQKELPLPYKSWREIFLDLRVRDKLSHFIPGDLKIARRNYSAMKAWNKFWDNMRYLSEESSSSGDTWKTMYNDVIRVIRNIAFSSVISSGLDSDVVSFSLPDKKVVIYRKVFLLKRCLISNKTDYKLGIHIPENILMRLCQPYWNLLQKAPKWYEVKVSQSSLPLSPGERESDLTWMLRNLYDLGNITRLCVENVSGFNSDPRSHRGLDGKGKEGCSFDFDSENFSPEVKLVNRNGITWGNVMIAVMMAKGSKFDMWYELFVEADFHVEGSTLFGTLKFDHGS